MFVRNDLFEQIIKSCKATNIEFTMLKEKLDICPYEENYYTQEMIQIQGNTEVPLIEVIDKVSSKASTKNSTEKLTNESDNELTKELTNEKVNSNSTSWYDTDKFNEILATIYNNNFSHKNKIGKLKFNDINDLINSIKGNTISEANTKKKLNELNQIKKVETNGKRLMESQKKLLSLFDDLKTIFNKTVNESNSNTKNESESDNESDYKSDNESDIEGEKDKYCYEIRQLNNWFETIDQTKSLEEQIELLKERGEFLSEYWNVGYYHGKKELNYKIFKAKAAYLLNELDEQPFKDVFGHAFAELVEKLVNTVDKKEDNQIIIDDIENNSSKITEQKYSQFVIQPAYKRSDLKDAVKITLEINELSKLDKVNND